MPKICIEVSKTEKAAFVKRAEKVAGAIGKVKRKTTTKRKTSVKKKR